MRAIIELLEKETPEFILPQLWYPNLPELNPVNYSVCDCKKVYKTRVTDELQQRLRMERAKQLEQVVIAAAIPQWRCRQSACVKAGGGHLHHSLWLSSLYC